VVALEDCELLAIARRDFLRYLREHPEAAIELMVVLAERLVRISEFAEDVLFLSLPARLAKKLLHLGERYGAEIPEGLRIGLKLSQGELADLVGTSRESVNKQMQAWRKEGVVAMEQGEITLRDPQRLEQLAGLVAT
jgi:CRP-like cAMP-binding protein